MRMVRCISLSMATGLVFIGCGFRNKGAQAAPGSPDAAATSSAPSGTPQAPSRVVYSAEPAVYTRGAAINPNIPYVSGGAITTYRVAPALPAGLSLDPASGIISGTPTAAKPATEYTITGSNGAGSTSVTLSLAVNDAAPATQPTVNLPAFLTASATGLSASTQDQGPGMNYTWTLQGGTLVSGQGSSAITFTAGGPGSLGASVTVSSSGGSTSARAQAVVVPAPNASMTLPDTLGTGDGSRQGMVPEQAGMTYTWTIVPGTSSATITSGQGTHRIGLLAGNVPGTFQVQVRVQNQAGAYQTNSGTVKVRSGN
ncbi:MAG: putative Ig domain-containing protein [Holophaga sp.]|nr:putative Ig domain-containing protein [Holophaga sp.]